MVAPIAPYTNVMLLVENTPAHAASMARNRASRSKAPINLKIHATFDRLAAVRLGVRSIYVFPCPICASFTYIQTSVEESASLAAQEPAKQRFYTALSATFANCLSAAPGARHAKQREQQEQDKHAGCNGAKNGLQAAMRERRPDEWSRHHRQHEQQTPTAPDPGAASDSGWRLRVGAIGLLIHRLLSDFSVPLEQRSSSLTNQHTMPDKHPLTDCCELSPQ